MSAFTFELREAPSQRCDLSPLTPGRLAEAASIERIEIQTTRLRLCVGDIFKVRRGDTADIQIEGGSERFDCLGAELAGGRIAVVGDLGQQVGRGMRGGAISVAGNVGRLAGSGMLGGRLEISGNAGELAGGPLPGEMHGMRGGTLYIGGAAGERAGDRMRRGLLVVGGGSGDHVASRVTGGTIVCLGSTGARPAYLMRRGTVIICGGAAEITPTFVDTGAHELVAMRLLSRWLIDEGIAGASLLSYTFRRLMGDTAVLGLGELFIPAA